MLRHGFRSRSVSLIALLAFPSTVLLARPARADWPDTVVEPLPSPSPPAPPAAVDARAPALGPVTALNGWKPIELHEVVWGDRHGHLRHAQAPFQDGRLLEGSALYRALGRSRRLSTPTRVSRVVRPLPQFLTTPVRVLVQLPRSGSWKGVRREGS